MSGMRYLLAEHLPARHREQAQRKLAEQTRRVAPTALAVPGVVSGLEQALKLITKRPKRNRRDATRVLLQHLELHGITGFTREHRFHPVRRWRLDFAHAGKKIALEIEGITFEGGRHQRMEGYTRDCAKYAEAVLFGWMLIRVTPGMVLEGSAIEYLRRALAMT